ncbi:hypothetical protein psyc5s11_15980 [Clostridium gelidum]|uniref:Uncharacterized protein n=1 Tax=Clostridium gelidum TaxID=704125 RepID=A0ABN6ITK3_9CLOT|nr:hypothetical protein psyc5s11_15980 [Clostridium gelidum]
MHIGNIRKNNNQNNSIPITILLNKIKKISVNVQKYVEFLFILKGDKKRSLSYKAIYFK